MNQLGSYCKPLVQYLMSLGIQSKAPVIHKINLKQFNRDLLLYVGMAIASLSILWGFFPVESIAYQRYLIAVILIIPFLYLLNYRQFHVLSRMIWILFNLGAISYVASYYGLESGVHYFFILICFAPIFYFRTQSKIVMSLLAIIGLGILMFWIKGHEWFYAGPFSSEFVFYTRGIVFAVFLILTLLKIYTFSEESNYYLKRDVQSQAIIEEKHRHLRMIIDLIPHYIFTKDSSGTYTLVNHATAATMGRSIEQIIGKTDYDVMSEALARSFEEEDLQVLNAGFIHRFPSRKTRNPRGNQVWVETIKTPIKNRRGEIEGILGIAIDITERKKHEEEISQKVQELNDKNAELERYIESNMQLENFAYIASHDLRQPLLTTMGFASQLEKRYSSQLDETGRMFLHHILQATNNMNDLIQDLLIYSRVHTDPLPFKEVIIEQIIAEVLEELGHTIEASQAHVEVGYLPGRISGNYTMLKQLFQNLIANAIKFKQPQQPPVIQIHAQEEGNYWHFEVSDNGIGIDPSYHEKIFLLFRRLHNKQRFEGSGMGLAICKKIVEKHQGRIWVESTPGQGSNFYFTLKKSVIPVTSLPLYDLKNVMK